MHNELKRRFSSKACEILSLANVFHPKYFKEENSHQAQKLAKFYGIDPDVVVNQFILFSKSREIKVWKEKYEDFLKMKEKANNDPLTKAPEVFGENSISNLYPDLFEVVKIVATLPATVASCERAHSKVKIINNYLRASMSDERLENLVHISIERDIADKIELNTLVDTFRLASNRKLPL